MKLSDFTGAAGAGGVPEAPNDGQTYGRRNLGWTPVAGGGGGIAEAPGGGNSYARRGSDSTWQVSLTLTEMDARYALIVHTHSYLTKAEADGYYSLLGHVHAQYLVDSPTSGGIYARQSGGWVTVPADVPTNLGNTPAASTVALTSSTGTGTTLPAATASLAGVMSAADKTKLSGLPSSIPATNLGNAPTATTVPVTSSTGTGTTLPAATQTLAGVMSAADKTKLDGVAGSSATNLGNTPAASTVALTSSTGTGTTLPAATASLAGVMSAADKTKLNGLPSSIAATNLGNTPASTSVALTSSTGTGTTLPAATTSVAGVMTAADKTKLNGLSAGVPEASSNGYTYGREDAGWNRTPNFYGGEIILGASTALLDMWTTSYRWEIWASGSAFNVTANDNSNQNGSSYFRFNRSSNNITSLEAMGSAVFDGTVTTSLMTRLQVNEKRRLFEFLAKHKIISAERVEELLLPPVKEAMEVPPTPEEIEQKQNWNAHCNAVWEEIYGVAGTA